MGLISGTGDAAIQYHNTGSVDFQQSATVALISTGAAAVVAGGLVATGVVTVTGIGTAAAVTTTAAIGATAAAINGLEDELHAAAQVGNMSQELANRFLDISIKNPGSNTVSIGLWNHANRYTAVGELNNFCYLDMPQKYYEMFNAAGFDFWKLINQPFLDHGINVEKTFQLAQTFKEIMSLPKSSTAKEIIYLLSQGYTHVIENGIDKLILPK